MAFQEHSKKNVSYFYDNNVGHTYFGKKHPMKPYRITIAHNLIMNYGLYEKMNVYRPYAATFADMTRFHSDDYILSLNSVEDGKVSQEMKAILKKFCIGTSENDCPVFEGLYDFCKISAGGSLAAAVNLNKESSDICINWSGGLHHAKKSEASGFCYVNDIVLAILELLKYHQRVLYIDIDIHHGDGVEEAFYTSDRVMTVSFHRFGEDFFPGSGGPNDIGTGEGKYYSLNVPMMRGMDDDSYGQVFVPIMSKVVKVYQPSVIILQCGADSLAGDRLGDFNLTLKGHGRCVEYMRSFNIPLMLLGGGGYTVKNVSRCWAYETAIALDTEISNNLPYSDYFEYFTPELKLHIEPDADKKNMNTPQYLQDLVMSCHEKLRMITPVPSVQLQETAPDAIDVVELNDFMEERIHPDIRQSTYEKDKQVVADNEFY